LAAPDRLDAAPLLEARHVGFVYGREPVLADITLQLLDGRKVWHHGPNTLIDRLLHLFPRATQTS